MNRNPVKLNLVSWIGFPVGGLTPPGRSTHGRMHGRTHSRFATVEGEAKQLSAPKLRGSPFGTLIDRAAKCAKIRNSTGTPCGSMHRKTKLVTKTPGRRGSFHKNAKCVCEMDDNENIKCENVTVALFALNFTWWARRVFQTESSLTLPYVLAVYCETEWRHHSVSQ